MVAGSCRVMLVSRLLVHGLQVRQMLANVSMNAASRFVGAGRCRNNLEIPGEIQDIADTCVGGQLAILRKVTRDGAARAPMAQQARLALAHMCVPSTSKRGNGLAGMGGLHCRHQMRVI